MAAVSLIWLTEPIREPEDPEDTVVLELVESATDVSLALPLALPATVPVENEPRMTKKRKQPPITDFFTKNI